MKRVKLSKFKASLKEGFVKLFEDQDRLRRGVQDNWPGESHSKFEEDADRLRRAKDGYGETEFEEGAESGLEHQGAMVFTNDEDLADVLGLKDKTNKNPALQQMHDLGNEYPTKKKDEAADAPVSQKKAKVIMKHGEVNDKELSDKQKKLFGFLAGGGKPSKKK